MDFILLSNRIHPEHNQAENLWQIVKINFFGFRASDMGERQIFSVQLGKAPSNSNIMPQYCHKITNDITGKTQQRWLIKNSLCKHKV